VSAGRHEHRVDQELRGGDEVGVSCAFVWGAGKTHRVEHEFRRADGTLAARVKPLTGLPDLWTRRLVPDPVGRWRERVSRSEVLNLAP
jgi:acyl-CoA thioester hydrolase